MDLILNGEDAQIDLSNCANLAELVVEVERAGQLAGETEECVVVGVEVDGQALTAEEMGDLAGRGLKRVARVSIQREPARQVALSVLQQGAEYSRRISDAIEETVQHFRAGRSDLGNGLLADVTDSMTVLTGITLSVAAILEAEMTTLVESQGEIVPWLEELIEAQGQEDPIRIGDLLEYEIRPRIEAWGSMMGGVSKAEGEGAELRSVTLSN